MARHRNFESVTESDPALDISSLIDVCFLLLIYFLVATTIQKKEVDVPMLLPGIPEYDKEMPVIDPLMIRIEANGAIFSGKGSNQIMLDTDTSVRNLAMLDGEIKIYSAGAKSGGQNPLVQIVVDGSCHQQRVIDVLDCLAHNGIYHITFTDM